RNPVANRLERKVEQIRKSGFDGVAGIILCDAHCSLLADRGGYSPMTFNLRQVVSHFCNHPDHTRVSFAITLSPEEIISGGRISTPITRVQSFFNPKARHPINEDGLDVLVRAIC